MSSTASPTSTDDESTVSLQDLSVATPNAEADKALEYKNRGNYLLSQFKYKEAIEEYTLAIECDPTQAVFYANRAAVYLKTEEHGAAVADATQAIQLDPTYAKGYYRRGAANFALNHYKAALDDFREVVRIQPTSKEARNFLKDAEKEYRRCVFEEALSLGDDDAGASTVAKKTKGYLANIDPLSVPIPDSYKGPHLGETITHDFVLELMEYQKKGTLATRYTLIIMKAVLELFRNEPNLVRVTVSDEGTFTVCGDVHGQYYDYSNIFAINGFPSPTNGYLFNGDFVDRGSFGVEVIVAMFAWKMLYPTSYYMVRGNHETKNMNTMYGFTTEVASKYSAQMMDGFTEIFNCLPLGSVIEGKVMTVHGGLFSKDGVTLQDIDGVDRFREPPETGIMSDMLWSDPQPWPGRSPSKRGVGFSFGPDVTAAFLDANGLSLLIRSHEVKQEGYEIEANGRLCTVFSAPNYCDQMGNKGGYVKFTKEMKPTYHSFTHVPHPDVMPMAYMSSLFGSMMR